MTNDSTLAVAFIDDLAFDSEDAFECESDEEPTDLFVASVIFALLARDERNRVPWYVGSIVSQYMDFQFKKLFRLSRSTAATLTAKFEASVHYPEGCRGRPNFSPKKRMLIGLTYLGTQASKYSNAEKFDTSVSTVPGFLLSISAREIHWPDRNEEALNKHAFQALYSHQVYHIYASDLAQRWLHIYGTCDGTDICIAHDTRW